jgi:hypothetical protein
MAVTLPLLLGSENRPPQRETFSEEKKNNTVKIVDV